MPETTERTEKRYGSIEEIKRDFFPKLYKEERREAAARLHPECPWVDLDEGEGS